MFRQAVQKPGALEFPARSHVPRLPEMLAAEHGTLSVNALVLQLHDSRESPCFDVNEVLKYFAEIKDGRRGIEEHLDAVMVKE